MICNKKLFVNEWFIELLEFSKCFLLFGLVKNCWLIVWEGVNDNFKLLNYNYN